jgi:uncharacterized protein
MLAGVVVGTLAGTGLLTGSHAGQAAVALGFLLMLYAVLGLTSVRFSVAPAAEWWLDPLIGALTGLITAATGVFAMPAVPYIGALGLSKDDMIQALGLSFRGRARRPILNYSPAPRYDRVFRSTPWSAKVEPEVAQ